MKPCLLACTLLAALIGCDEGEPLLTGSLVTDLRPGIEFVGAVGTVALDGDQVFTDERAITEQVDLSTPLQIFAAELPPEDYSVRIRLLTADGSTLLTREALVQLRESQNVVVSFTRSCLEIRCEADETCRNGACTPTLCEGDACSITECEENADCTEGGACSVAACAEGACVYGTARDVCDLMQYCDPARGCVDIEGVGTGCRESCDDGDPDTLDRCIDGACVSEPISPPPPPPEEELCNGFDDDSDGGVDEDFNVGGACMFGTCGGALVCASESTTECVVSGLTPETCDGADNDCDGEVDEETDGDACMVFGCVGAQACVAGAPQCQPASPEAETCDGEDNDCDGAVDEEVALRCPSPGCSTEGTATCTAGELRCTGGGPSESTRCDGMDSDCDGELEPDMCNTTSGACLSFNLLGGAYLLCGERSWEQALASCSALGYEMLRIESEEENTAVFDLANAVNPVEWIWLAARNEDGEFRWQDDGSAVSDGYTNFGEDEPNGFRECLRLQVNESATIAGGEWGDRPCGLDGYVMCQHPSSGF